MPGLRGHGTGATSALAAAGVGVRCFGGENATLTGPARARPDCGAADRPRICAVRGLSPRGRPMGRYVTDRLYLRQSAAKQTNACQLHALDGLLKSGAPTYEDPARAFRVYAINRSGFRRLLDEAAVGDTIRIADAARLFRSSKDVIQIREVLRRRDPHLHIATGAWSGFDLAADAPQTKLFVMVLARVLEFQRDMISENTKEGVAAAEVAGKTLGRPAALDKDQAADVVTAYREGAAVKHWPAITASPPERSAACWTRLAPARSPMPTRSGSCWVRRPAARTRSTSSTAGPWSSTCPVCSPTTCRTSRTPGYARRCGAVGRSVADRAVRCASPPHSRSTRARFSSAPPSRARAAPRRDGRSTAPMPAGSPRPRRCPDGVPSTRAVSPRGVGILVLSAHR